MMRVRATHYPLGQKTTMTRPHGLVARIALYIPLAGSAPIMTEEGRGEMEEGRSQASTQLCQDPLVRFPETLSLDAPISANCFKLFYQLTHPRPQAPTTNCVGLARHLISYFRIMSSGGLLLSSTTIELKSVEEQCFLTRAIFI